jgi:hypothetical protein
VPLRHLLVLAAAFAFGAADASVAAAAKVTVTPSVLGAGTITAPGGYGCINTTPYNWSLLGCATTTASDQVIFLGGTPFVLLGELTLTAAPHAGWKFIGWESCPTVSKAACSSSTSLLGGDVSTTPKAVFQEIVPVTIDAAPPAYTNNRRPTFRYASTVADATFTCQLNTAVVTCPGTRSGTFQPASDLADGKYTFKLSGIHNTNPSITPASHTFVVDTVAPDTTLSVGSGPGEGALQTVTTETFTFASERDATFECRLNSGAFTPCKSPHAFSGLGSGKQTFEVRARDRAGNVDATPAKRSWTIAVPDDDGDGFNANVDCDDTNPAIHPGANDLPGNGVDENCDGADTPAAATPAASAPERIVVTLAFFATAKRGSTKFTQLQVKNVPLGATVNATCKGKGCPAGLKRKGFTKRNAFGTVSLARFIKKPLRAGVKITVTVSKPNAINAVKVLTVRPAKKPSITTRCLPPGAKTAVAC